MRLSWILLENSAIPSSVSFVCKVSNSLSNAGLTACIDIRFSHHCFTVEFVVGTHQEHHTYSHSGEKRAFDIDRYALSLQLPAHMHRISGAYIHHADNGNYRYMVDIPIEGSKNRSDSIFFNLALKSKAQRNHLKIFVVSTYIKSAKFKANARARRFKSLVVEVSDIFSGACGWAKKKRRSAFPDLSK